MSDSDQSSNSVASVERELKFFGHTLNLLIAVGTLGLMFFTYLLWAETRNLVIETNEAGKIAQEALLTQRRAWLVPIGARFKGKVVAGLPVEIETVYENVGGEPAIIGDSYLPIQRTGSVQSKSGDARDLPKIQNDTCRQANTAKHGLVIYPKQTRQYTNLSIIPPNDWDEDILSGASILYVTGCITYTTVGALHRSAYCFYLRPTSNRKPETWRFYNCGSGNFAD